MKYLNLETFTDFVCIGGKCEFTCCSGGWSIYIDKDTDRYYRSVTGEMGERLCNNIQRENGVASFIPTANGKCPFLNDRGLCDIYIKLGEEYLSDTCTYYPRYAFRAGDIDFAGVSISCPEVSKFYLTHEEPLLIDFAEDDSKLPPDVEHAIDWKLFNNAVRALTCLVGISQNRDLTISERLALIIVFIDRYQSYVDDGNDPSELINLFSVQGEYTALLSQTGIYTRDYNSKLAFCSEYLALYGSVNSLSDHIPQISEMVEYYTSGENEQFDLKTFTESYDLLSGDDNRIWQENLLTYIIYRYFMQGFSAKNFREEFMVGFIQIYCVTVMTLILYYNRYGQAADMHYIIMLVARISRVVEHGTAFRNAAYERFHTSGADELSFLLKFIS